MRSSAAGISLIETALVTLIVSTAMAIAVPGVGTAVRRYKLTSAVHQTAGEIRAARLKALTANRTLRVRFDCPVPGQFRVVELMNNPAIDNDPARCSDTTYPFPDPDPAVAPNQDGPARRLHIGASFAASQDFDISPTGRVTAVTGVLPISLSIGDGYDLQTFTVSAAGQVQVP
jgi:type II secretory pathway pseudopilin PulG